MAKVAAGALPIARPPPIRDWRGGTPAVSSLDRVLSDLEVASREAAGGDRAGRESPIVLRGEYKMHWLPFSSVSVLPGGEFRYLAVPVPPPHQGSSPAGPPTA